MSIHRVATGIVRNRFHLMDDELVAVEIEVDPMPVATALGAAQQIAVKAFAGIQVVHCNRQMKRRPNHSGYQRSSTPTRAASGRPGRAPNGRRETT